MKPGRIDLHVHTTASDGTLSPRRTLQEAAARGVSLVAITDHDTTDGLAEACAAAAEVDVLLIPGFELSSDSDHEEIHLLAYFVRPDDPRIQSALADLRAGRNLRNRRILARLHSLGIPLPPGRIEEIAGFGSVGRPHIAAALVEAGHVASQTEAFTRYLARGKPAFVSRPHLTPARACAIIKDAGGLAVLAHPAKISSPAVLQQALADGVDGIEVYHSDHRARDVQSLLGIARERGLLATGGTDSHGPHTDRPSAIGSVSVPTWVGEELLERAPAWWRRAHS